jgi:hypothetical protein
VRAVVLVSKIYRDACSELLEELGSAITSIEAGLSKEQEDDIISELQNFEFEDTSVDDLYKDPTTIYSSTLEGSAKTSFVSTPQPRAVTLVPAARPRLIEEWNPVGSAQRATRMFGTNAKKPQFYAHTKPLYDASECSATSFRVSMTNEPQLSNRST